MKHSFSNSSHWRNHWGGQKAMRDRVTILVGPSIPDPGLPPPYPLIAAPYLSISWVSWVSSVGGRSLYIIGPPPGWPRLPPYTPYSSPLPLHVMGLTITSTGLTKEFSFGRPISNNVNYIPFRTQTMGGGLISMPNGASCLPCPPSPLSCLHPPHIVLDQGLWSNFGPPPSTYS